MKRVAILAARVRAQFSIGSTTSCVFATMVRQLSTAMNVREAVSPLHGRRYCSTVATPPLTDVSTNEVTSATTPVDCSVRTIHEPGTYRLPADFVIPEKAYTVVATRGSGPGGQGVNSSSNKAELRVSIQGLLEHCEGMDLDTIDALREQAASRINKDDILVISSHESRSLNTNIKACLKIAHDIIYKASYVPIPDVPTPPPKPVMHEKRVRKQQITSVKRKQRNEIKRLPRM